MAEEAGIPIHTASVRKGVASKVWCADLLAHPFRHISRLTLITLPQATDGSAARAGLAEVEALKVRL